MSPSSKRGHLTSQRTLSGGVAGSQPRRVLRGGLRQAGRAVSRKAGLWGPRPGLRVPLPMPGPHRRSSSRLPPERGSPRLRACQPLVQKLGKAREKERGRGRRCKEEWPPRGPRQAHAVMQTDRPHGGPPAPAHHPLRAAGSRARSRTRPEPGPGTESAGPVCWAESAGPVRAGSGPHPDGESGIVPNKGLGPALQPLG